MDAVTAAILGLSILLVTGVVTWKECLAESIAWDTLTWFAALIAMAGYLNKYGLISWFSQTVVKVCLLFIYTISFCMPFRNCGSTAEFLSHAMLMAICLVVLLFICCRTVVLTGNKSSFHFTLC